MSNVNRQERAAHQANEAHDNQRRGGGGFRRFKKHSSPCNNGAECKFLKTGSCKYFHALEHRRPYSDIAELREEVRLLREQVQLLSGDHHEDVHEAEHVAEHETDHVDEQ